MKSFTTFNAKKLNSVYRLTNFTNVYAFCFKRNLLSKYSLTYSDFNYTDRINDGNDGRSKDVNNKVRSSVTGLLYALHVLIKVIIKKMNDKEADADNDGSVISLRQNTENMDNRDSASNEIRDAIADSDSNDDDDSNDDESNDDDEDQFNIDDNIIMEDDDSTDVRDNDDNNVMVINKKGISEYLYVFETEQRIDKDAYIVFILPLFEESLKHDAIRYTFENLYERLNKKETKDKSEKILCGIGLCDTQKMFSSWCAAMGIKTEKKVLYPCDVFDILTFVTSLRSKGMHDLVRTMLLTPEPGIGVVDADGNNTRSFIVGDNYEFSIDEKKIIYNLKNQNYDDLILHIPKNSYRIPIKNFTHDSITDSLIPGLPEFVTSFFLNVIPDSIFHGFSHSLTEKTEKAFPTTSTLKTSDPLGYLKQYVNEEKRKCNGVLSKKKKLELLELFGYIIENPKLKPFYSNFIQSIISFINKKRRIYQWRYPVDGYVPKFKNDSEINHMRSSIHELFNDENDYSTSELDGLLNENIEDYEIGPLTRLLYHNAKLMMEFKALPGQYSSFALIVALTLANCHDRKNANQLQWMLIGKAQGGKDWIIDIIKNLVPQYCSTSLNGFSRRAFATNEPFNGGVVIMNEAKSIFTADENTLSASSKEELDEWKEIFTEGVFRYKYLNHKATERKSEFILVEMQNCFLMSTNRIGNRDQPMGTRIFPKTVFCEDNFSIVDSIMKSKSLPEQLKTIPLMMNTFHELYILNSLLAMVIDVGIIAESTIGITADITKKVLQRMRNDGVEGVTAPRSFTRNFQVGAQLIYSSVNINEYMSDNTEPRYFHYSDFERLEKKLTTTTEIFYITFGHLYEQYLNPVKFCILLTVFKVIFSDLIMNNLCINSDDMDSVRNICQEQLNNDDIKPKKKKRKKMKKRRKVITRNYPLGMQSQITPRKSSRVKSNEEDESFLFEIALQKLDKILMEMKRLSLNINVKKEYRFERRILKDRIGIQVMHLNLNFIERERMFITKKKFYREMHDLMNNQTLLCDVEHVFNEMERITHIVPIYFHPISLKKYNEKILVNYDVDSVSNKFRTKKEVRLTMLRMIFESRHNKRQKTSVFTIRQNINVQPKRTIISFHHTLTNEMNPRAFIIAGKDIMENKNTKKKLIFVPVTTKRIFGGKQSKTDWEFMLIKPNQDIDKLRFVNNCFVPEDIMKSRTGMKKIELRRNKMFNDLKTKDYCEILINNNTGEDDDVSSLWYTKIMKSLKKPIIEIEKDLDVHLKEERKMELDGD